MIYPEGENMIRAAVADDASRIAEILIFTKRMNYRDIFHDDQVSFGQMQVYPLVKEYIEDPGRLNGLWVYDDGFVKGLVHIEGTEIAELYVDSFFAGTGIGSELMKYAIEKYHCNKLWVLEKNSRAIRFYERFGFAKTDNRQLQEGTPEYKVLMSR